MPVNALLLVCPGRPWVGWWVADPRDRRVEFDVCLPPGEPALRRWSFIDLELDVVLHLDTGASEVLDWPEFYDAVDCGVMDPCEASSAIRTVAELRSLLEGPRPTWLQRGWDVLRSDFDPAT